MVQSSNLRLLVGLDLRDIIITKNIITQHHARLTSYIEKEAKDWAVKYQSQYLHAFPSGDCSQRPQRPQCTQGTKRSQVIVVCVSFVLCYSGDGNLVTKWHYIYMHFIVLIGNAWSILATHSSHSLGQMKFGLCSIYQVTMSPESCVTKNATMYCHYETMNDSISLSISNITLGFCCFWF